jgi:predicted HAD superfamily phosphohydrolase YqeG
MDLRVGRRRLARPAQAQRRERRTPLVVVDDLPGAIAAAARWSEVLVVDLENTLVDFGSTAEDRERAMTEALTLVAADGRLTRLAFVSNAPFKDLPALRHAALTVHTLARARKPHIHWFPLRRIRSHLAGAAVYGDQPLTDGLLAHHLRGVWLQPRHAYERPETEPWVPRWLQDTLLERGRQVIERRFEVAPASGPPE